MMHVIVELKHTFKGPWRRVDRVAAVQAAAAAAGGVFQDDDPPDDLSVSVQVPVTDDDSCVRAFVDALSVRGLAAPYINACIEWRRPRELFSEEIDAWIKKVEQHGGKFDGDFEKTRMVRAVCVLAAAAVASFPARSCRNSL